MNTDGDRDLAARTRRRITRRLMPFLFLLYIFNYLNRVNVGYAALQMLTDLGFSNSVFGLARGFSSSATSSPNTLDAADRTVERTEFHHAESRCLGRARRLVRADRFSRAVLLVRFFLGIAQAGFFPGVIVYLTHWFRYEDRAKTIALFMLAIPTSNMIGAAISAWLMRLDWLGWNGWRWLLILEGLPTVVLGVVAFFYLTDRPKDATWLAADEREWISAELEREKARKKRPARCRFCRRCGSRACSSSPSPALLHHQQRRPRLVAADDRPAHLRPQHHAGDPHLRDSLARRHADDAHHGLALGQNRRTPLARRNRPAHRRRRLVAEHCRWQPSDAGDCRFLYRDDGALFVSLTVLSLPTMFLSGPAAAASVALINATGNLGGFAGPYIIGYLADRTGNYNAGLMYLIACGVIGSGAVLSLRATRPDAQMPQAIQDTPGVAVARTPAR